MGSDSRPRDPGRNDVIESEDPDGLVSVDTRPRKRGGETSRLWGKEVPKVDRIDSKGLKISVLGLDPVIRTYKTLGSLSIRLACGHHHLPTSCTLDRGIQVSDIDP